MTIGAGQIAGHVCPSGHPFAFNNGRYCCKYQENEQGSILLYESKTCKGDKMQCPNSPCLDNYGTFLFLPH